MQGKNRTEMKNLLGIQKQVDNGEFEAVHLNLTTVCNNISKDSKASSGLVRRGMRCPMLVH
jgi:hypothetical protein